MGKRSQKYFCKMGSTILKTHTGRRRRQILIYTTILVLLRYQIRRSKGTMGFYKIYNFEGENELYQNEDKTYVFNSEKNKRI